VLLIKTMQTKELEYYKLREVPKQKKQPKEWKHNNLLCDGLSVIPRAVEDDNVSYLLCCPSIASPCPVC
jgi:hypothetical protein